MNTTSNRLISWPGGKEPSRMDWIRLAAFIDGEGCIRTQSTGTSYGGRKAPQHDLLVQIANCDPRLPNWCKEVFGGNVYIKNYAKYPNRGSNRDNYYWHASCNRAKAVIRGCLPYFMLKREQAEVALALAATYGQTFPVLYHQVPSDVVKKRLELASQLKDLKRVSLPADSKATYGRLIQ